MCQEPRAFDLFTCMYYNERALFIVILRGRRLNMPKIVLGENLRHALKERALPGFYWGITVIGALFALMTVTTARGTKGFEVLVLIFSALVLIGLVLGALSTYLWREVRSSSQLPDLESGRTWKIVPTIFGLLGAITVVSLNWFLNSNTNQKGLVTTAVVVLIFCLNFIMAGSGLGSLGWLGVDRVRNQGWVSPRPPVWRGIPKSAAPSGGPPSRGLLRRVRSHLGWVTFGLLALLLFGLGVIWMTTPYTPTKPNSAGAPPVPATATIIVLPSPTTLPTATSVPTVPPVPAPPTGAPIAQPTAGPVSTATPTKVSTVAPKPTVAKTPVPLVCTYATVAGDTWSSVAAKLGVTVGEDLMKKNQGLNPAQPGTVFKSPRPGCP